jgi:hypothetical protein
MGTDRNARCTFLGADYTFGAVGLGAGVGDVIALAVEADDEHGAAVSVAGGLSGSKLRGFVAARRDVADALTEAAMAEFVGAVKIIDAIVGIVGSNQGFHGSVVTVAEGQDVRPHALRV